MIETLPQSFLPVFGNSQMIAREMLSSSQEISFLPHPRASHTNNSSLLEVYILRNVVPQIMSSFFARQASLSQQTRSCRHHVGTPELTSAQAIYVSGSSQPLVSIGQHTLQPQEEEEEV